MYAPLPGTLYLVPSIPGTWCSAAVQAARFRRQRHSNVLKTNNFSKTHMPARPATVQQITPRLPPDGREPFAVDCSCGNKTRTEQQLWRTPTSIEQGNRHRSRKHQLELFYVFTRDIPHPAAPPHLPNRLREELQHPTPYRAPKTLRYPLGHPHGSQVTCIAAVPTTACRCPAS